MKKWIIISLAVVVVVCIFYLFAILPKTNYTVCNENGTAIPGNVYKRYNRKYKAYDYILYLTDTSLYVYNVLVISPQYSCIGTASGGDTDLYFFGSFLIQFGWEAYTTSAINELAFEDDPVRTYSFSDFLIQFNTFEDLRKVGKFIKVIRK